MQFHESVKCFSLLAVQCGNNIFRTREVHTWRNSPILAAYYTCSKLNPSFMEQLQKLRVRGAFKQIVRWRVQKYPTV